MSIYIQMDLYICVKSTYVWICVCLCMCVFVCVCVQKLRERERDLQAYGFFFLFQRYTSKVLYCNVDKISNSRQSCLSNYLKEKDSEFIIIHSNDAVTQHCYHLPNITVAFHHFIVIALFISLGPTVVRLMIVSELLPQGLVQDKDISFA